MNAMRITAAIVALGALGACTAGVQVGNRGVVGSVSPSTVAAAPLASPKDRLVSAIEQQGCVLNSDNVAQVLLRANLTQQELMRITPELAAEGRAEVSDGGTIRVLSNNCI